MAEQTPFNVTMITSASSHITLGSIDSPTSSHGAINADFKILPTVPTPAQAWVLVALPQALVQSNGMC